MKARIILWSAVGILVILGIVLIVATSGRRPTVRKTLENVQLHAERTYRQLERVRLGVDSLRARAQSNPEMVQKLEEFDRLVAAAKEKLEQIKSATTVRDAENWLREAKELVRQARRKSQLIGGTHPLRGK